MSTEYQHFMRRIDNVAIDLGGRELFVETDVEFTLSKTVFTGDWWTPDDWEIDVHRFDIKNLWLIDPDRETCMAVVLEWEKQAGYDDIDPDKVIDDLLQHDDNLLAWVQERGLEIMP